MGRLVGWMPQVLRASFTVQTWGICGESMFATWQQDLRTRRSKLAPCEARNSAPRINSWISGHRTAKVGWSQTFSQVIPVDVRKEEGLSRWAHQVVFPCHDSIIGGSNEADCAGAVRAIVGRFKINGDEGHGTITRREPTRSHKQSGLCCRTALDAGYNSTWDRTHEIPH